MGGPLLQFAEVCDALAATTKKLEKIQLVADYFRSLHGDLDNAALGALYLCGRVFPRREERGILSVLGIASVVSTDATPRKPDHGRRQARGAVHSKTI